MCVSELSVTVTDNLSFRREKGCWSWLLLLEVQPVIKVDSLLFDLWYGCQLSTAKRMWWSGTAYLLGQEAKEWTQGNWVPRVPFRGTPYPLLSTFQQASVFTASQICHPRAQSFDQGAFGGHFNIQL